MCYNEIYNETYSGLGKFVSRRARDSGMAEDILQEVYLEAIRHLEDLKQHENPIGVDSMIRLLDQMDGRERDTILDKEEFAGKYLRRYVNPTKGSSFGRVRAAVILAAAVLFLGVCNFISVRATSRDIFTNLKEKVYIVYFDVLKDRAGDNVGYDRTGGSGGAVSSDFWRGRDCAPFRSGNL